MWLAMGLGSWQSLKRRGIENQDDWPPRQIRPSFPVSLRAAVSVNTRSSGPTRRQERTIPRLQRSRTNTIGAIETKAIALFDLMGYEMPLR
jgi:hypothetical protein